MQDDTWMPTFYVGQYETERALPVTSSVLYQAHDCNVGTQLCERSGLANEGCSMICLPHQ